MSLGVLYLQRSRYEDALTEFDAASRLAPQEGAAHLLRALALDALGRSDAARMAFHVAWTIDPDDPARAYLVLARSVVDGPDLTRIIDTLHATYRRVIQGARRGSAAPFFDAAVLGDATTGEPVFPLARYLDGFDLLASGQHEEGLARLRQAAQTDPLVIDPVLQTARMTEATAALRGGDLRSSLTALQTVVQAHPKSSEAHRALGTAFRLAGNFEKSAEHLDAALRLRRDDERSWIALASTRADSGDLGEAVRALEAAVAAVPSSGELRWRLGELFITLERNADALEQFDAAARLQALSGRSQVHQWVATLASMHQEMARAADAVERRVSLNLNDAAAHRDLATVYTKLGRQDEALGELVIAAWLNPDDPLTFVALGHNHMAARRDDDAVTALQRAVTLQPDLQEARYALAQALMRGGRRDEAAPHLSEFQRLRAESMERARRDQEIAGLKAEAVGQSREGQHRRAAQTWTKVVALEPELTANYLDLSDALVMAGGLEESLQYLVKAAALDGIAEVHLRLADVLARLGRAKESALARETYERLRLEDFQRGARP
jgi:tetratricopeptide (TPR) repeat protein